MVDKKNGKYADTCSIKRDWTPFVNVFGRFQWHAISVDFCKHTSITKHVSWTSLPMKCNTKTLYFQPKPQPAILRRHGHARKPSDGAKQDLFPIVEDKVVSDNQHQKNLGSSTSSEDTVKANTIKEVCACCLKFELQI